MNFNAFIKNYPESNDSPKKRVPLDLYLDEYNRLVILATHFGVKPITFAKDFFIHALSQLESELGLEYTVDAKRSVMMMSRFTGNLEDISNYENLVLNVPRRGEGILSFVDGFPVSNGTEYFQELTKEQKSELEAISEGSGPENFLYYLTERLSFDEIIHSHIKYELNNEEEF